MALRTLTAAALLVLATAAAVAGCGGSPAPPAGGATAPATGRTGATAPATGRTGAPSATGAAVLGTAPCASSPSAMVAKALGLAVGKVVATAEGRVTVCAYTGRYEVLVRYQTGESAGQFALDRQSAVRLHQSVTAVSGLGDQAFLASLKAPGSPSYTLAARKSNMAIFITSPVPLGPERTLMVQLLGKS